MGTLNSYGCISHGTGNSSQLCQNFRISGGGLKPPKPPLGTPLVEEQEIIDFQLCFKMYLY
jgi:hypothetical protein